MTIKKLVLGGFQTNTYIIIEGENAVVIDPADDKQAILDEIAQTGTRLTHILLTHGHFDHTKAVQELTDLTKAQVHIHEKDVPMLGDIGKSFASFMPNSWRKCSADVLLKDGDVINVNAALQIRVIGTPGHSPGSVMYAVEDTIFSGDTLFSGSVGRVDGWGGSHDEQMATLQKIMAMSGDYRILPGHGDETTLLKEKRSNPFLAEEEYE